jgi:hypothetical protein
VAESQAKKRAAKLFFLKSKKKEPLSPFFFKAKKERLPALFFTSLYQKL